MTKDFTPLAFWKAKKFRVEERREKNIKQVIDM